MTTAATTKAKGSTFKSDEKKPEAPRLQIMARGSFVVLKLVNVKTSRGGIIIPNGDNEPEQRMGVVVSVGDGMITIDGSRCPHDLKRGDVVYLRPRRGVLIMFAGQPYIWCDQSDIPCVVRTSDGSVAGEVEEVLREAAPEVGEVQVGARPSEPGVEGDP